MSAAWLLAGTLLSTKAVQATSLQSQQVQRATELSILHVVCPDSTRFSPLSFRFTPQQWAYLVVWHMQSCQLWELSQGCPFAMQWPGQVTCLCVFSSDNCSTALWDCGEQGVSYLTGSTRQCRLYKTAPKRGCASSLYQSLQLLAFNSHTFPKPLPSTLRLRTLGLSAGRREKLCLRALSPAL